MLVGKFMIGKKLNNFLIKIQKEAMPLKLLQNSRKALSIDFGSAQIKIIEGQSSKKGINISKSFTIDLPKDAYGNGEVLDETAIAIALKNSLKENNVSTNLAYGTINSSAIITREISIPKVPEKEIASIIGYQLGDYLPVDPENYVVEHLIIGTTKEMDIEKINILLIAIPKKMVLDHLNLMKSAGLKPQVLDYQGNSITKLLGYNSFANEDYNVKDTTVVSIDIGYINSKVTIIKNGNIEVARVIEGGSKVLYDNIGTLFDYTWDERISKVREIEDINVTNEEFTDYHRLLNLIRTTIDSIMEKIEMVFKYYTTRETGNIVNFILLQGGLSNINGVDNLFSNYFNIPSVKLHTLDKLKCKGDLSKYSNAIGGLIRLDEVGK